MLADRTVKLMIVCLCLWACLNTVRTTAEAANEDKVGKKAEPRTLQITLKDVEDAFLNAAAEIGRSAPFPSKIFGGPYRVAVANWSIAGRGLRVRVNTFNASSKRLPLLAAKAHVFRIGGNYLAEREG